MGAIIGTPRARALSSALREARITNGIGQRELARQLGLSNTQLSHWENGHRVPNPETVAMILAAIRVAPDERERILDLARNVSEPNWLTVGMQGVPQQLAGVVESERAASRIVEWAPMLIPGLLQTSDYTRAIKQTGGLSHADIELRLMISTSRREVLTRRDPVTFEALIGESALHDVIGSHQVMADQLKHLLDVSSRPNVTVHIVPTGIGWHPGLSGPFVLYQFPDTSPVVHFEHHSSGAFVPTEYDVREYHKAVDWLRQVAMDHSRSSDLIAEIANEQEA